MYAVSAPGKHVSFSVQRATGIYLANYTKNSADDFKDIREV
jgi:hypothetical protein